MQVQGCTLMCSPRLWQILFSLPDMKTEGSATLGWYVRLDLAAGENFAGIEGS